MELLGKTVTPKLSEQFDLALGGELEDSLYAASLKGRIFKTDLQALGFAEEPLTVSLTLDANASAQTTDSTATAAAQSKTIPLGG